jgi:hypothetical protein
VGRTAGPNFLRKLCFLSLVHDRRVLRLSRVHGYHFGQNFLVEVDLVRGDDLIGIIMVIIIIIILLITNMIIMILGWSSCSLSLC